MSNQPYFRWVEASLVAAFLLCSCTTDSVRKDTLSEASAPRTQTDKMSDAYETLWQSSREQPGDADLHKAAEVARVRYGRSVEQSAEKALLEHQPREAMMLFQRLSAIPGFETKGMQGLRRLNQTSSLLANESDPPQSPARTTSGVTSGDSGSSVTSASPLLPAPLTNTALPLNGGNVKLSPMERKITLEFRDASVRSLFDAVAQVSGLNVVFDRDIQPDIKTTVYLRDTTIKEALDKIVLTSGLAWRKLDEHTLLVYADELSKQNDYQNLVVRSFQLFNADAKFVASSLKTVLKFRDLVVDEKLNMIVVRDTPEAMKLAEKLIAMHDVPEPEVTLEVAVLEINRDKTKDLGIAWPGSMSLSPIARTRTTTTDGYVSDALTLRDLTNLTPGGLGLSMGSTTVNVTGTDSNNKLLANPSIRVRNREKAKILIGERVPNVSSSVTSTGVTSETITYVDVGLKLEVEPQIFPGNQIGLKLGLEVSSINSTVTTTSGIIAYRIGTRTASTVLRLNDGENQILGGLIQDSDKKTVTKVPLLAEVPILGRLFRSDSIEKDKTEIVLSITPHLVRGNQRLPPEVGGFDAGTVSSVRGRRGEPEGGNGNNAQDSQIPGAAPPTQASLPPAANNVPQSGSNGDVIPK